MVEKKTKLKEQKNVVTIVLLITAIILLVVSFFISNSGTQSLLRIMGYGFIIASIIFRLFKGEFGYKPTREEIEERMFGNIENEIEHKN